MWLKLGFEISHSLNPITVRPDSGDRPRAAWTRKGVGTMCEKLRLRRWVIERGSDCGSFRSSNERERAISSGSCG